MDKLGSERGEAEYWLFPLIGLLVAIGLAFGVGALQGREFERRSLSRSQHVHAATADTAKLCMRKQGRDLVDCVQAVVEEAETASHDEQDLTAQQQAAWAAILNTIFGSLSMAGALLGLVWIKGTLDATRQAGIETAEATEAMRHANQVAEEAARGWLSIDVLSIDSIGRAVLSSGISVTLTCKLTNSGDSPVNQISLGAMAFDKAASPTVNKPDAITGLLERARRAGTATLAVAPGGEMVRQLTIQIPASELRSVRAGLHSAYHLHLWIGAIYQSRSIMGSTFVIGDLARAGGSGIPATVPAFVTTGTFAQTGCNFA